MSVLFLPCSMHWSDLHRLLIKALPEGTVKFSHKVSLLEQDDSGVNITAVTPSGEMKFHGDIVIAADGVGSFARKQLVPGDTRRCTTWSHIAFLHMHRRRRHPCYVLKKDTRV